MIKFVKRCVWSHKVPLKPKTIEVYEEGKNISGFSEKDEQDLVTAGYAVYCNDSPKDAQTVKIETKDVQTQPARKGAKTTDDTKSD